MYEEQFKNQQQETDAKQNERSETMMVSPVAMVKRIAANEKSKSHHACFKK